MTKKVVKKQTLKKKKTTFKLFGLTFGRKEASQNGALYGGAIIGVVAVFGAVMGGGITPTLDTLTTAPTPGNSYTCCDSGDGAACHPIMEKQITYNGNTYALLKSNVIVN